MSAGNEPRRNGEGDLCPPWCRSDHDAIMSHLGERRGVQPGSELSWVDAVAFRDGIGSGDRKPSVLLSGYRYPDQELPATIRVACRDAGDLAAVTELLAEATPDQHRELAEAVRAAAADIEQAAAAEIEREPEAGL